MNVKSLITVVLLFIMVLGLVGKLFPLELVAIINQEFESRSRGTFRNVFSNQKGEFVWNWNYTNGSYNFSECYYSSSDLKGTRIGFFADIKDSLIQLGFKSSTPPYAPPYSIRIFYLDESGNVLIAFGCIESGALKHKLGVWHKDHGFKYLPISGIDSIDYSGVSLNNNVLIVPGIDNTTSAPSGLSKLVVFSVVNGFWPENEKEESYQ